MHRGANPWFARQAAKEGALDVQDQVANLAGLVLGHALWNVCDFEEDDDVLCPLAFAFDGQENRLLRFEAEPQEETIKRGLSTLSADASFSRWAFAREGILRTALRGAAQRMRQALPEQESKHENHCRETGQGSHRGRLASVDNA